MTAAALIQPVQLPRPHCGDGVENELKRYVSGDEADSLCRQISNLPVQVRDELSVCFGQVVPVLHGRDHAAVIVAGHAENSHFLHDTALSASIEAWRCALGNSSAVSS